MTEAVRRPQLSYLTDVMNELKAKGTHFRLRVLDDQQAPVCHYDGKEVINLASNNYLGLANHPKLMEASLKATRELGVGSGAVRTIAGTMRIHMELEEKIAQFKNVEACVVFQSGFAANAGTVSAFFGLVVFFFLVVLFFVCFVLCSSSASHLRCPNSCLLMN